MAAARRSNDARRGVIARGTLGSRGQEGSMNGCPSKSIILGSYVGFGTGVA